MLFSTAYLPPISYLKSCLSSGEIIIDPHEHYIKQTFRNRCNIYGPNGKQALIIPVDHDNLFRKPLKDIKISNESHWNKIHWKSICTAYRNTPFFEFFEEDFEKIFSSPPEFLFEFNMQLFELVFKLFKVEKKISFTESYEKNYPGLSDLRNAFHPRNKYENVAPYHQVFADRHGFIEDLSCIDLLFNEGSKKFL
jgi:hypothetical protein